MKCKGGPLPKGPGKLALWGETWTLCLPVCLVLLHIPSVQIPEFEKHGGQR